MSKATIGAGVVVSIGQGDAVSTTDALDVFDAIGEITSCSAPEGAREAIDVTNLDSTAAEFIAGLIDSGEATFEMNHIPSDTGQTSVKSAFSSGQHRNFRIALTSSPVVTYKFQAIVTKSPAAVIGGPNAALTSSFTVKVSGLVTES